MPVFVDGVEMAKIFIDGVEMAGIFVDGVQVFSGGSEHIVTQGLFAGGLATWYGHGDGWPNPGVKVGDLNPPIETIHGRVVPLVMMSTSTFPPNDTFFYVGITGSLDKEDYGSIEVEGIPDALLFSESDSFSYVAAEDFTIWGWNLAQNKPPLWDGTGFANIKIGSSAPPPEGVTHNLTQGIWGGLVGYNDGTEGTAAGIIDVTEVDGRTIRQVYYSEGGIAPQSLHMRLAGEDLDQDFFYSFAWQGINDNDPLLTADAAFTVGGGVSEWRWSLGVTPPRWEGSILQDCWGIEYSEWPVRFSDNTLIQATSYPVYNMIDNGVAMVAVGGTINTVDGVIYSSSDGGGVWSQSHIHSVGGPLLDVAWGNGLFVAVGGDRGGLINSYGLIYTSPNGFSWTERSTTLPIYTQLNAVIWSQVSNAFLACGRDGNDEVILRSTDGITWSRMITTGGNGDGLNGFTEDVANGVISVVGVHLTGSTYRNSTDGINWGSASSSGLPEGASDILYAPQPNKFYSMGSSQRSYVHDNNDGVVAAGGVSTGWLGSGQVWARANLCEDGSNIIMTAVTSLTTANFVRSATYPVQLNFGYQDLAGAYWAGDGSGIHSLTVLVDP